MGMEIVQEKLHKSDAEIGSEDDVVSCRHDHDCACATRVVPEVLVSSFNVQADAMFTVHKKAILLGGEDP